MSDRVDWESALIGALLALAAVEWLWVLVAIREAHRPIPPPPDHRADTLKWDVIADAERILREETRGTGATG
jgi:hypothetical protein